jgi:hypothetical protein
VAERVRLYQDPLSSALITSFTAFVILLDLWLRSPYNLPEFHDTNDYQ